MAGLILAALTVAMTGCASSSLTQSTTSSPAPANSKTCLLQSHGTDLLKLSLPPDTQCKSTDGFLDLGYHGNRAELWLVPHAQSLDDATPRINQIIHNEFQNLKVTHTTPLTIAGSPAQRLQGPGTEADDGDEATADLILFQANHHIFLALAHGEDLHPSSRQWLLTVVHSAQTP